MAIKITTQIETSKGATSEAYVRIINYMVNKYGIVSFMTETYLSQSDSVGDYAVTNGKIVKCEDIGDNFYVSLKNEQNEVNLSPIINQDIFSYGYSKLKEKLIPIYGESNIVNC